MKAKSVKSTDHKSSCGCGGHGHSRQEAKPDPRIIMVMELGEPVAHLCHGSGGRCPRHYHAAGLMPAGFLVLRLSFNLLGCWPATFQAVVSRARALGIALVVQEVGLVFLPLAVHAGLGVRTLARERLTFGVRKHHHGSDLRQAFSSVSDAIWRFWRGLPAGHPGNVVFALL